MGEGRGRGEGLRYLSYLIAEVSTEKLGAIYQVTKKIFFLVVFKLNVKLFFEIQLVIFLQFTYYNFQKSKIKFQVRKKQYLDNSLKW